MSDSEFGGVKLRLPATSANLGPGFDAVALALALYLDVDAEAAERFSIEARGRSPEVCGATEGNLLLQTYRQTCEEYGVEATPLALRVRNGIPLGMGCGSSAASRLAGIALASHFGGLGWDRPRMLDETAALEQHPDNAAACVLGGFAATGFREEKMGRRVAAVSLTPPAGWHALLVLPPVALATTVSRAVLPAEYRRAEVVENLQNTALLTAAFATGNSSLLAAATRDRLHQPFRGEVCPLLPRLLPLVGQDGILSVTLSGAGSGVLLLLAGENTVARASERVREAASASGSVPLPIAELLPCGLCAEPAHLKGVLRGVEGVHESGT